MSNSIWKCRIEDAISETVAFKPASGEVWKGVLDEVELHTAARAFAALAKALPAWRIDDLGRAFNLQVLRRA